MGGDWNMYSGLIYAKLGIIFFATLIANSFWYF